MNPWIRLYRQSLHSPKIVSLSDRQHRAWHNCLLIANDDGSLPPMRDIAVHMRVTIVDAEQLICELVEAQLVDPKMSGGNRHYHMHDWSEHQYLSDNSTARSQKHRKKKACNGDATLQQQPRDVSVTPPDSDSDSETDKDSDSEAPRENFKGDEFLRGVRVGAPPSSIEPRTKIGLCKELGLADIEPVVDRFWSWQAKAKTKADNPDALFRRMAPKLLMQLPDDVRRRITIPPPERPYRLPATASTSLKTALRR